MNKNVIRGGHNFQATGARGILDETTEDRKIYPIVINYLKQVGNSVLDGTPSNCDTGTDLAYGVNIANSNNVDYFASVHLNCGGGHGCEVIYGSEAGRIIAQRICENLAKLGFTNRGAKPDTRGLYEIHRTNMIANIIEVFFCDSQSDVDLYNKVGIDTIGKAIAEGILGHSIEGNAVSQPSQPEPIPQPKPQPQVDNSVLIIQQKLRRLHITDYEGKQIVCDNTMGERTRSAIRKFEEIMGLSVDSGIWGNQCESAYQEIISKPYCDINNQTHKYAVRYIQWLVGTGVDSIWGKNTNNYVYRWQARQNISADSKFGNQSWGVAIG